MTKWGDSMAMTDIDEATRLPEELWLLQQTTAAAAEAEDVTEALDRILALIVERAGWLYGGAWLPTLDGASLTASPAWRGDVDTASRLRRLSELCRFRIGEALPGKAWQQRRPVWFSAEAHDPRLACIGDAGAAAVAIPILAGSTVVAVVEFAMARTADDEAMVEVVALVAAHLGASVRRRQLEDRVAVVQRELERSNAELQAANEELARSNADLAEFAYVASHDLSEPLRVISGHVQLLARRYDGVLDEDAARYIAFAVDGCSRMQSLITDLLAYSRVGQSPLMAKDVDCNRVVDEVLIGLGPAIADANASVDVGDLPSVVGDPGQLRQLFGNLIGNAVKFTAADVAPRVTVRGTVDADGCVRFAVADTGIGVPERHRERIFRMFQRLHRREDYSGTGIGLAICRRIVERHGGRIEVEDTPGGGATFVVVLPSSPRSKA